MVLNVAGSNPVFRPISGRPHRLSVRTSGSHPGKRGSIPRGGATYKAMTHIYTVPGDMPAAVRADVWLSLASEGLFSRSRIRNHLESGAISRNGAPFADTSASVRPGDVFTIEIPDSPRKILQAQNIPLAVIYEDADIIVVDKPPGLVTHPSAGHPDGTLVNALLNHAPEIFDINAEERPGIVHRLDQDTSGVMVAAKNDRAMSALLAAFQNGLVRKTYRALVHGIPADTAGRIETLIGRHPRKRQEMAVVTRNGKNAISEYRVIEEFFAAAARHPLSLLEVRIETGRTHQIRVHCRHIGHPVAGDRVYGSRKSDTLLPLVPARQMLHAATLTFPHPVTSAPLIFDAPLPADFEAALNALRAIDV